MYQSLLNQCFFFHWINKNKKQSSKHDFWVLNTTQYLYYCFPNGWRAVAEDNGEGRHTWSHLWSRRPWSGPCSVLAASPPCSWYRAPGVLLRKAARIDITRLYWGGNKTRSSNISTHVLEYSMELSEWMDWDEIMILKWAS